MTDKSYAGFPCLCEVCGESFFWWHANKKRCELHPHPKPRVRIVMENGKPKYVRA